MGHTHGRFTMATKTKKAPIITLVVGLLLLAGSVGWAIFAITSEVSKLLPQQIWTSGEPRSVELADGDWAVYAIPSGSADQATAAVDSSAIKVSGPDGNDIPVACISCGTTTQSTTVNGQEYLGIIQFTAPTAGTYTIDVRQDNVSVAVGRPVLQSAGSLFGGIAIAAVLGMLGFVLVVTGIIWLVVISVNNKKVAVPEGANTPEIAAQGTGERSTPRGWYPEAQNPDQLRWWDGKQWTEHVRPKDE